MEIWVRDQSKEEVVNASAIWYVDSFILKDGNYIIGRADGMKYLLGEYSTKEKVLKVLDIIQKHINNVNYGVFQMPQDDEV